MSTKAQRRKLHEKINSLPRAEVAAIVKRQCHRATGKTLDTLAKQVIAAAHARISRKRSK